MKFVKMHGLGNDYVFLGPEEAVQVSDPVRLCIEISRQHFGVGSDGLVLILPSDRADAKMRMFNQDGSEAEMCGNALRCVGKYLYESGRVASDKMVIDTGDGLKPLKLNIRDGRVRSVAADMGSASFGDIVEIGLGGKIIRFQTVSVGNPHAVTFDIFPGDAEFEHYGSYVERHPLFPNRTNVEFCRVLHPRSMELRVWERGAGATLACGTGSTAAFAAGVRMGLIEPKAEILLPGGKLIMKMMKNGHICMAGPAEISFTGEFKDTL